ncbi:hypothetical protein DOT_2719 [Desulfosporosinus sp. OT]|nr:hypothetical protein DOT_2719 [Desulfosporosinus sp. OT]
MDFSVKDNNNQEIFQAYIKRMTEKLKGCGGTGGTDLDYNCCYVIVY